MASKRKAPKPTTKQLALYIAFQALQSVSSRMASLMAYQLWFHPSRQGFACLPGYMPDGVKCGEIKINKKRVVYWSVGEGKTIFMMHGWSGCGKQFADMAQAFIEAGYRVIWMDAPAHCASEGWQTSLFEFAQSIVSVQQQEGPFEAVVAHSFGVPCSLYAMAWQSLQVERFISIAAPSTTESLMDGFCKIINANPKTRGFLEQRFTDFLGDVDIADTSALTNAKRISQPCLVIHDKHDRVTRAEGSKQLCEAFVQAQYLQTEHLGHNKILRDKAVIEACVKFVAENNQATEEIQLTG